MKKIFLMVALMVAAMGAQAQNNDDLKNEIGVYYGFGSASNIVSAIGTAFNFNSEDQTGFWGPVGVEYYYRVTPMVSLGAAASIAGCTWSKKNDTSSKYISVMPSVKLNWIHREHFGLYSAAFAGLMFHHANMKVDGKESTDNSTNFMGHLTAIGAEAGGQLRGFAEIGFGERGMLTVGLRYKF